MSRSSKTAKRMTFLENIIKIMREHEYLGKDESRKGINENEIQKAVFSRLNKHLPNIIKDTYGLNEKKAHSLVETDFVYESKKSVSVNGFPFFATNHRPDAVLAIDELRIAFEIKKNTTQPPFFFVGGCLISMLFVMKDHAETKQTEA